MKYHRFLIFFIQASDFITYDIGFASQYHGFLGNSNTSCLKELTFSGTFERPPQISIVIYKYNYDYYQPNGYEIQITEITTYKFKVQMRCLHQHRVWKTIQLVCI